MATSILQAGTKSTGVVQVNLYEAKTQLSSLVERASKGEEIVIAKAGKAMARLVPIAEQKPLPRRTFGQNLLGITFMADDWEDDIPLEYFDDENGDNPFRSGVLVKPQQ